MWCADFSWKVSANVSISLLLADFLHHFCFHACLLGSAQALTCHEGLGFKLFAEIKILKGTFLEDRKHYCLWTSDDPFTLVFELSHNFGDNFDGSGCEFTAIRKGDFLFFCFFLSLNQTQGFWEAQSCHHHHNFESS